MNRFPTSTAVRRRHLGRILALVAAAGLVAGCDKCGNRVKWNAPSLPNACGENANPAR